MSKLTDMFKLEPTNFLDTSIIPQIDNISTQIVKEQDKYICNILMDMNIDKDILINQTQEIRRLNDIIKHYKELQEQGLLLKLPCKIGTIVYVIDTIYGCKHDYYCPLDLLDKCKCEYSRGCEYEYEELVARPMSFRLDMIDRFGKTVFLTKEEAEQELKRLESAE